ncbi:hypothetical protein B0H10DRAFT_28130 [Mycena sp. CBHHK59/15]|nr:hypothetical protein B0H10DRAFT_28130 [Mycena sp. CBHHK59/15]
MYDEYLNVVRGCEFEPCCVAAPPPSRTPPFSTRLMYEDAQPNDPRGRRDPKSAIPAIRPTHNVPTRRGYLPPPLANSFKRVSDPSYTTSPAKRRRLDRLIESSRGEAPPARASKRSEQSRKEVVLPHACQKGAPDSHRQRKQFIALEIKSLQNSHPGLKVISHTVMDGFVQFLCLQTDILNCSLAPHSEPTSGIHQNARIQPKVEPIPTDPQLEVAASTPSLVLPAYSNPEPSRSKQWLHLLSRSRWKEDLDLSSLS